MIDLLKKRLLECVTSIPLQKSFGIDISLAEAHWASGNREACEIVLNRIPTIESLSAELLEKLRGKRVFKTLKQINEGKDLDRMLKLKALSSFFTHAVIECEQGRPEFEILLPQILESITAITFFER